MYCNKSRNFHVIKMLMPGILAALSANQIAHAAAPAFSPYQPTAEQRIEGRPAELWRFYMHGIVDYFAQPVDLESLVDKKSSAAKWIVRDRPIDTPFFKSDQPALRVDGGKTLNLSKPLPIDLNVARGKALRVFVWVSGEDIGRKNSPNSYSEPPNMVLTFRNNTGRALAVTTAMTGSTGTFPWHCYSKDTFVPEDTDNVTVHFYNKHGGPAFFSNISWEVANTQYSSNDRQDPTTGSWASNPWHDQLNQQFRFVYGYDVTRYKWRFFEGPAIGLVAQSYNVSTPEGLRNYYNEKVKSDNDHMNHSLMYFASRYNFGRKNNLLPTTMDEKWMAELTRLIIENQDEKTGYWGTSQAPISMGITFHFVEGLFSYYGYARVRPSEESRNDMRHLDVLEIPRADRIIETTLAMQYSSKNERGEDVLGAWPHSAYNFTTTPNDTGPVASLSSTNNAIDLMRRCERFVSEPLRKRVYVSIRAAIAHLLANGLEDDGAWKQATDSNRTATDDAYMPRIISASHYLERVPMPELAQPKVTATRATDGSLNVTWIEPEAGQNSLRLYLLDQNTDFVKAEVTNLIGVIHRTGQSFPERDPFLVVQQMEKASQKRWGKGWPEDSYVQLKTAQVARNLPQTLDAKPLKLAIKNLAGKKLYAVAATWYGEESKPVAIEIPR